MRQGGFAWRLPALLACLLHPHPTATGATTAAAAVSTAAAQAAAAPPYEILWNSPWPAECADNPPPRGGDDPSKPVDPLPDWARWGIATNNGSQADYNGQTVATLYADDTGLFPQILGSCGPESPTTDYNCSVGPDGTPRTMVNGGIPQVRRPPFSIRAAHARAANPQRVMAPCVAAEHDGPPGQVGVGHRPHPARPGMERRRQPGKPPTPQNTHTNTYLASTIQKPGVHHRSRLEAARK